MAVAASSRSCGTAVSIEAISSCGYEPAESRSKRIGARFVRVSIIRHKLHILFKHKALSAFKQ